MRKLYMYVYNVISNNASRQKRIITGIGRVYVNSTPRLGPSGFMMQVEKIIKINVTSFDDLVENIIFFPSAFSRNDTVHWHRGYGCKKNSIE